MATTHNNDAAAAREKADADFKALFEKERAGVGALTEAGGKLAQLCVDEVYPADALLAAHQVHEIRRGVLSKSLSGSDRAQISKLSNFATAGLAWNRKGIKLVKALVERSEGLSKRYTIVQTVLVRLKKRRKRSMPSIKELVALLAEAQQPKPPKSKSASETVETSSNNASPDSTPASRPMSDSDIVRKLDAWIEDFDTPKDVAAACEVVRGFAERKASADFTPGVKP